MVTDITELPLLAKDLIYMHVFYISNFMGHMCLDSVFKKLLYFSVNQDTSTMYGQIGVRSRRSSIFPYGHSALSFNFSMPPQNPHPLTSPCSMTPSTSFFS